MATCPYCDGRLSPEDIDQGRCSHCHAAFFSEADLEGIDTKSHTAQTLDSASPSSVPVEDSLEKSPAPQQPGSIEPPAGSPERAAPLTIDSLHKDQTIDSVIMPPHTGQEPPAGAGTLRDGTGTVDSGSGVPTLLEDEPGGGTCAGADTGQTRTLFPEYPPGQPDAAKPGLARPPSVRRTLTTSQRRSRRSGGARTSPTRPPGPRSSRNLRRSSRNPIWSFNRASSAGPGWRRAGGPITICFAGWVKAAWASC